MSQVSYPQVVWRGGTATSQPVALDGTTLCGLHIPAGFTGVALTVQVSDTGTPEGNFSPMTDAAGATLTYTVAPSKYVRLAPDDFRGVGCFRLVSGASEAANTTVRAAARELC